MNVLVTGAAGFIGSHVVEHYLNKGYKVIGFDNLISGTLRNLEFAKDNKNFSFYQIDIRDRDKLFEYFFNVDILIHAAALADIVPSITNPVNYFETNVTGTLNIMEYCKAAKVKKIIYIASSSCYGIPSTYPTPEYADISPEYPYALTKYLGELVALHWSKVYKIPVISLRLFNVYGPRARTNSNYGAVLGVFLAQKIANKPLTIVGDGDQSRDFTHVADVVRAIDAAAVTNKKGIYNVGSGKTYKIKYLASLISEWYVNIPKRPGEPNCTFADISKIGEELNWTPSVSLEMGVADLLNDLSSWNEAPVWTPEAIQIATKEWFKYLGEQ